MYTDPLTRRTLHGHQVKKKKIQNANVHDMESDSLAVTILTIPIIIYKCLH